MSKRPSEVPQVPNPYPSSRVESGTDAGVEASTGLLEYRESNNGALAIADPNSVLPSSNAAESIVEPGTTTLGSRNCQHLRLCTKSTKNYVTTQKVKKDDQDDDEYEDERQQCSQDHDETKKDHHAMNGHIKQDHPNESGTSGKQQSN